MRSRPTPGTRCPACHLPSLRCLCPQVRPVQTRTELVVVRHALEGTRSTNTARLAALVLPRLTLVDHGHPDGPFDEGLLSGPDTWLLYPGAEPCAEPPPVKRLVVLDGTWSQARRMLQRLGALRGLPRLSLPAPRAPLPNLRKPRVEGGMSTIEAIAAAIELLEGEAAAQPLRDVLLAQVRAVRAARGDIVDGPAAAPAEEKAWG